MLMMTLILTLVTLYIMNQKLLNYQKIQINFKNVNILIDRGIIDYNKNKFEVFGNFYLYEGVNYIKW